jgi:two-component system, OmpR family, response regulator TrcR
MKKVLIIEDDVNLGLPLMGVLEMHGFEVMHLIDGDNIMHDFLLFKPDLVILDVMLNAKLDGFEVGNLIRTNYITPILFTTSREGNEDFEKGFGISNTDYVRKPYRLAEVLVRLNGLLSRQEVVIKVEENCFHIGIFIFFPNEQALKNENEQIHLNKTESTVLSVLCENINSFVSRNEIVTLVWKKNDPISKEGSLNNILTNLRKYLKNDNRIVLDTRVGLGVRLSIK